MKEQLKDILLPVLNNLAEPNKMSLPFIEGLYRLVENLQFAFKPELGKNLLEHLVSWSEPVPVRGTATRSPVCVGWRAHWDHDDTNLACVLVCWSVCGGGGM